MARRIILFVHSTLNGVVTGDPDGDVTDFSVWTRPGALVGEASRRLLQLLDRVDTVLLGRGTYDDLCRKWPNVQGPANSDDVASRLGVKINSAKKLVATRNRQLLHLPWGDFASAEPLACDDIVEQLHGIKAGAGGDIVIFGSPTLVRSLADAGLIDEFHILVHPVIVEVGERLFEGVGTRTGLDLKSVATVGDGGVLLVYSPDPS